MKNKKGFTLAEVLVTLAVIGVVAALTIPALIQSSNEKQAKTSIKKALSTLNQALTMSIAQDSVDAGSASNATALKDIFNTYISTITSDDNSITTSDGMIYTFATATACTNSAANTDCFVEVDINGNRGSSNIGTTSSYSDIYYFAILKEQVVPANTAMTNVGGAAWGRANADPVGTMDNVAIDALLN